MSDVEFQVRQKNISDLDIIWAIRDIPKSIINLPRKGILLIFVSLIGNRKSIKCGLKSLENSMGASERQLRDQFNSLEEIGFLLIKRPKTYVKGLVNEYGINYELLLSAAEYYREQKVGYESCR